MKCFKNWSCQKMSITKDVQIFISEIFLERFASFWHIKFSLKVRFLHFLMTAYYIHQFTKYNSFLLEYWFVAKSYWILYPSLENSTTKIILIYKYFFFVFYHQLFLCLFCIQVQKGFGRNWRSDELHQRRKVAWFGDRGKW